MFALATVTCTLAGYVLTSALGINPAWAAFAGAIVLAARALARRRTTPAAIVRATAVPFLAFVLALGIVVRAVTGNGLATALGHLIPGGTGLPALLDIAALAAALANVINNLPAVLVQLPLTAPAGPGAVLAVLLGVNIGPNLTYAGSLATLLWRRMVREHDTEVDLAEFTRLGLLAVPGRPAARGGGTAGRADRHRRLKSCDRHRLDRRGTWPACADATRTYAPEGAGIMLLHVTGPEVPGAARGAYAGLLGRARPERDPGTRLEHLAAASAGQLLAAAAERRGRPCTRAERSGRVKREVVAAAEGADLLVLARDGDRTHLGPRSLGPASRFVVDHAPCPVLLVWPAPSVATIPPPSPHPPHRR